MSLDNLPVEWLCVNGSDCVFDPKSDIVDGPFGSNLKSSEYTTSGIPVLRIQNIKRYNFVDKNIQFVSDEKAEMLSRHSFQSGDIVITKLGNPIALACIVPPKFEKGIIVADLVRMRPASYISTKYMMYYLNSKYVIDQVNVLIKGTTRPRINLSVIRDLKVVLPSQAEQQEIVRQLDVMLAQVEQIKARLDAIPALLKKFRQSVLADAVSGKLTEGANCSKWIKSTIGAEFKCIDGDRGKNYPKKEDYQTEGYCLFLSTKNVRKFGFLFDDKVFISKQKHEQLRNGTLERDDLIITTRGTLGHIASYDKNVPFDVVRINSGMLILRKTKQNLLNEFMMLLLASPKFQRIIEEQRTGSAQPQLPAKILKEFEIELPSLDEQKLIVQKVESYFELIEKTEDTVQSAQKRVNLLTQSILAKAFSGELTAEWREQHQDLITGLNSAEALLAKIQAEREASKPVKKAKKVK